MKINLQNRLPIKIQFHKPTSIKRPCFILLIAVLLCGCKIPKALTKAKTVRFNIPIEVYQAVPAVLLTLTKVLPPLHKTLKKITQNKCIVWNKAPYNQALDLALQHFHEDQTNYEAVIHLLLEKGAPITQNMLYQLMRQPSIDTQLVGLLMAYIKLKTLSWTDDMGNTPLMLAVKQRAHQLIEKLVNKGVYLNHTNKLGMSALSLAIQKGDQAIAEFLIASGSTIDAMVLHETLKQPNTALVQLIIAQTPADVINAWQGKDNPLLMAIKQNNIPLTQVLIQRGAAVGQSDQQGNMALRTALMNPEPTVLQYLIESGVAIDSQLLWSVIESKHLDPGIVSLCIKVAPPHIINTPNHLQQTPLMRAVIQGKQDLVQILMRKGAAMQLMDAQGNTALYWALAYGHMAIAEFLLEQGAPIDEALLTKFLSTTYAKPEKIYFLVQILFPKNQSNGDKKNKALKDKALHYAIQNNDPATADYLIQQGACIQHTWVEEMISGRLKLHPYLSQLILSQTPTAVINQQDCYACTPLMNAVMRGKTLLVEQLVERGADLQIKQSGGLTALDMAIIKNNVDLVDILLKHGARFDSQAIWTCLTIDRFALAGRLLAALSRKQINQVYALYDPLLMYAVECNATGLIKQLIQQGANVNLANSHGKTALHVAIDYQRTFIARYLIDQGATVDHKALQGVLYNKNIKPDLKRLMIRHADPSLLKKLNINPAY